MFNFGWYRQVQAVGLEHGILLQRFTRSCTQDLKSKISKGGTDSKIIVKVTVLVSISVRSAPIDKCVDVHNVSFPKTLGRESERKVKAKNFLRQSTEDERL